MPNVLHLAAAAALLLQVAPMPVFAAESTTGSWEVRREQPSRTLDFHIRFSDGRGSNDDDSIDVDSAVFGLRPKQFQTTRGNVTLAFKREAGSFDGNGTIANGAGGGTVTFTPGEAFRADMHERGYDLTGSDCLRAALLGLSTTFVDDVGKLGYEHLELHELWAFLALGVTEDYLRKLAKSGYSHLSVDDVVKLKALGIDGRYVERVESHGFTHPTIDQLVKLKAMNVVSASCLTVLV